MSRAMRVGERMRPGAMAVAWHDSAEAALAQMRAADLDAIPVINNQHVIGLVERHAAHACQRGGDWLGSVWAASLMRRGAFVGRAGDTVEHALATMDRFEVDLLAVIDEAGRVVGVIDRDAIVKPGHPRPAAVMAVY